ncbi:tyrosine-type recombinase/integrase [Anaeromyxobacter soli]|uniref:tyrosine-type recombinase/integrase n=1 Tax=Anaeromyxobacter soli TaxID=2922725 RepID=UPI001FAFDC4C|nr:site-specific integrase [Anaeromyxobacter sp. SG29]
MSDVTVRRKKHKMHVAGCQKLRTCQCPFTEGDWQYDIRFTWPSGTPFREKRMLDHPDFTKKKALDWATERRNAIIAKGEARLAREAEKPVPTLKDFGPVYIKDYCKANRNKPRTIERKEGDLAFHLIPRFGNKRLDEISLADIQRLKGDLADLNAKTVNNVLSVLRTILDFAAETGVIPAVPVTFPQLKTAPAEIDFYEPDVYEKLVAIAKELDARAYLMMLLGGEAGLRRGEIAGLEWNDIDFTRRFLHVQRSESKGQLSTPKSGRSRRVDLSARLIQALRENRHARGSRVLWRDPHYRWDAPHAKGGVWDRTIQSWMERVQRRAGLEVTGNVHILRHTFCSRLAMGGAPTLYIMQQAGHADIKTTQLYMHLAPSFQGSIDRFLGGEQALGRILVATETGP